MKKSWIREASDTSLNDRLTAVRQAVSRRFNDAPGDYTCCEVVFDDYVILSKAGKLWRIDYTIADDGTVTLNTGDPVQVRVSYTPVKESTRFEGQVFGVLPDRDGPVREGDTPAPPTGKRWAVLIIQEGMSKNRNKYSRKVLQEGAPLYEGAKIFLDHKDAGTYGRSTKDQAGFLKDVQPCILTPEAEDGPALLALAATAIITKPAVRQEMLEAYEEGNPNYLGLSHDAMCRSVTVLDANQRPFYDITKIESVASVDLVTNPAAGGRVLRLVASDTVAHSLTEDGNMLTKMVESIKASGNAALIAKLEALGVTPNEDQVLALYSDLARGAAQTTEAAPPAATVTTPANTAAATTEPVVTTAVREAAVTDLQARLRAAEVDARANFVEAQLAGVALHEPVKARLRSQFQAQLADGQAQVLTKESITARIQEEVTLFGQLAEKNIVMPVAGLPRFEIVKDRRDKITEAFDEFFGVKKDDKARGGYRLIEASQQRLQSFRNLYVDVTGDRAVTGKVSESTRLTESLGTASFGEILGDSVARRMVAEYVMGSQAQWRGTIADVVPVADFRTQRRMRFGGYGNLSAVTQGGAYAAMTSPTDEEATYAASKRGGTEQITLEMIVNDDVGAIKRLPQKMARAASQTLYEFVFDFMRSNPTIYDSTALAAAGHGNNTTTSALSNTTLGTGRLAIRSQTDMSNSKRIGLASRYLWVPPDLEELAFWLCTADRALPDSSIPGTAASGAPNFQRKLGITPVTVDYWTDANNWWLTSSVADTPMIEIGFLSGREEPEMFVQDMPNVGSMFTNDAITYKLRHIYGGGVLDYRGFFGGIVP